MSEQDTREQLEADIERYLSQAGCHEMVCGWLDRQAAITRYIERGMHDFILDRLERENDKLTAERDELQKRNEQLEYANKLASKSEARKIECIDKLEAERDELQAAIGVMGYGQFYAMYRRACEERDALRERLEAITAALRDKPGGGE